MPPTVEPGEGNGLNRARERLRALGQIAMAAAGNLDQRQTLQLIADQVRRALPAEAAQVLAWDGTQEVFTSSAMSGLRARATHQLGLLLGQNYARRVIEKGVQLHIEDLAANDAESSKELAALGFKTYFAGPLICQGKLYGVLAVFSRKPFDFDQDWRSFFESISGLAAIAIENARLREQVASMPLPGAGAAIAPWAAAGEEYGLNESQRTILKLLVAGRSNRQIAEQVHLGENTVKFHLREIFRKLGVRNRVEAAMLATSKHLV